MGNMLQDGADYLVSVLMENASVSVVYRRGGQHITLDVIPGSSLLSVTDQQMITRVIHTDRTYFIDPATMGALYPPRRGDTVVEGSETYECLNIPGENMWKHEDQYGRLILAYFKRVS